MIVVTGVTGNYGRQVVEGLLQKLPTSKVGVSVRDAAKAEPFKQLGVRVCQADFADPSSLRQAFDGAEQVLLVSVTTLGAEGFRQHTNAIEAARDAGVRRLLYTSHQGRGPASIFLPTVSNHVPTDALLATSGIPYVSLQNGFYAESSLFQLRGVRESGKITLPQDGLVNWTTRADLAEAAVAVLLNPGLLFDGPSPALTASELLDFSQIAAIASSILNRPVEREQISDEAFKATLLQQGMPAFVGDLLTSLYQAARAGEFATLDPTLERLLGRKPTTMQQVLKDHFSKS